MAFPSERTDRQGNWENAGIRRKSARIWSYYNDFRKHDLLFDRRDFGSNIGCEKGMVIKMREYFRYFRWVFITIAVLTAILGGIKGVQGLAVMTGSHERTNTGWAVSQRVFDHADVLTDSEEKSWKS